jgi:hypothetical protein
LLKACSISIGLFVTLSPALLCLFALSSTLYSPKSWGQTTYTEKLKPALIVHSGQPEGWFDTPEEAFAAHQAWLTANCRPGWTCTIDSLQPCTMSVGFSYYWDTPANWCFHYQYVPPPGGEVNQGITSTFGYDEVCPFIPNHGAAPPVINLVSGTGQVGDPRHYQDYCQLARTAILACEACVGDPIYPASGTQFQLATDYSNADGVLAFDRYYDNAYRRFRSEYEVAFVPPNQSLGPTCIVGQFQVDLNGNQEYFDACFTVLNVNPVTPSAAAVFTDFKGARDELSWNGTDGFSTSWDFKSHLTTAVVNGAQMWLLLRPGR